MEAEKSNSSSFEDLSNENVKSNKIPDELDGDEVLDIVGNGQLLKRIIKKSDSEIRPQRGDLVKINLTGVLEDGTIVEDQQEEQIHVGDQEVVQGVDMAIAIMKLGEVAEITVESRFGYGSLGLQNEENPSLSIPPDAKIKYTVELLDIKTEDEYDCNSFEARKRFGNRKRERANFWYNRNDFNIAIQVYRRALEFLDDTETGITAGSVPELTNAQLQELLDDRLIVFNNLAIAQIKISAFDAALNSVDNVLRCQPNNSKALYRKGRIMDAKGDTKSAINLIRKAATLEPDSKTIQQELAKLIMKARREERNEKEMYQKMLGQANRLEQRTQGAKHGKPDIPKLKYFGYFFGSVMIAVFGVAFYRYKY